ncbi:MAG: ABC transporter ATP-binding protein [Spirochaetes bacterium]|nr:ABC transporter ATP-binding protein [Spirochaetota bacterium]
MSSVSVRDVRKSYRLGKLSVPALNGVDLFVEAGKIVGIVGPSGSGKTTLLNMIGCIDRPDDGIVEIDGINVVPLRDRELTELRRSSIGFVFQSFNLIPVLSARENVELPLIALGVPGRERKARVDRMLELVDIAEFAAHKPDELSGGQRQQVAVARALVIGPKIVLADEPTANLDGETGRRILSLMQRLNREIRTTFILATHDPRILPFMDSRIYLEDGIVTRVETLDGGAG